jgi:hypothetical protein
VAARFEEHTRADRASCSRVLQRLALYPRLQEARSRAVHAGLSRRLCSRAHA